MTFNLTFKEHRVKRADFQPTKAPNSRLPRRIVVAATTAVLIAAPLLVPHLPVLHAQEAPLAPAAPPQTTPPATGATTEAPAEASADTSEVPAASASTAAGLIGEALSVAEKFPSGRVNAVRGVAALLPRLDAAQRSAFTPRWLQLAMSNDVPRALRSSALAAFFDGMTQRDPDFARRVALMLPDAAGRAGAFLELSRARETRDWTGANDDAVLAIRAARKENSLPYRARALTFAAYRISSLNAATRRAIVVEASGQVHLLPANQRDYLLAELVGAASKFDIPFARRIADSIGSADLKNLAQARINISEISQSTLTGSTSDRIAALAKAAAPYDVRAVPILIQLPPQADVLKSLSEALPQISPTSRPNLDISLLEQMWTYSSKPEASVYRDQLQSRLARLMILQDPWRGREWGKQLSWKGGRVQTGAFLKNVLQARTQASLQNAARIGALPETSERNVQRALSDARRLPPSARVESLLLIAGQLLA